MSNNPPLHKCPQCNQVKRERITNICQACHDENAREVERQEALYRDMPVRPPCVNRNLIDHQCLTHLPEPHEYLYYYWRMHIKPFLWHIGFAFAPEGDKNTYTPPQNPPQTWQEEARKHLAKPLSPMTQFYLGGITAREVLEAIWGKADNQEPIEAYAPQPEQEAMLVPYPEMEQN